VEGDARSFRVALVADALVNPPPGGVDALPVLDAEGFGVIQLPSDDYPEAVAAPLLEQVAEQAEEFARHGYVLVLVGARDGLAEALAAYGVPPPLACAPATADELHAFLRGAAGAVPGA
jgi:hypothetical protein